MMGRYLVSVYCFGPARFLGRPVADASDLIEGEACVLLKYADPAERPLQIDTCEQETLRMQIRRYKGDT